MIGFFNNASLHTLQFEPFLAESAAYIVEKDAVNIKIASPVVLIFLNIKLFSSVSGVIIFGKDLISNQKIV